ncbi:LytR/AlgR family response regulator transcription factor [Enterocloster sp.]|uniref:LytR/AlgR family response regulator transcription factor n=1 Tax=Enterocloster sp. TaxID=2719315 RepID=UPI0039A2D52B
MRVALCDDESYVLSVLEDYFQRYADKNGGDFSLIKFTSGIPLLKYVEENNDLDIIFLDIQMPELNGIEVAHIIRKKDADVKIFFLTSIIKYALEGYKVNAERYLTKPLNYGRFQKELERVIKALDLENKRFFIEKNDEGVFKINLSDILYIETVGRNTRIHTKEREILSYHSMKEHEEFLDKSFFRCHRGFIINLKYVKETIDSDIILNDRTVISLSKYRKKEFKEALLDYYGDQLG